EILLDEDNSRHIVQVLRMKEGEELLLTDGKGNLLTAAITGAAKKKCRVKVSTAEVRPPPERRVAIGISPVKNGARFEWFLEKATEVGVTEIIPLICDRTERQQVRADRLQNILVSAMLQSRQVWLPVLRPATPFGEIVAARNEGRRMIAWLGGGAHEPCPGPDPAASLILIGPEGDFTGEEAAEAMDKGFIPVSLGHNRLRTETAGVVAATLLCVPR
ncbi:MAG TPA: RsmE family RNA methyltransferase, partial [Puia sp.]|nr:RsmE family RNA methyltransferase [Puia sp.]